MRALLACALVAASASAAEGQDRDPRDAEARALFERGELAYSEGRFDDAYALFRRSYDLSGRPGLLYNMGQAADRAGRRAEALEHLEAYLGADPDASNRRQVEARIEVLRRDLRAQAALDGAVEAPRDDEGGGAWWPWVVAGAAVVGAAIVVLLLVLPAEEDPLPANTGILVHALELP